MSTLLSTLRLIFSCYRFKKLLFSMSNMMDSEIDPALTLEPGETASTSRGSDTRASSLCADLLHTLPSGTHMLVLEHNKYRAAAAAVFFCMF